MRNAFFFFLAIFLFISCNQKKDNKQPDKKVETGDHVINKDGIGDLKIGMTHIEAGALLNKHFTFNAMKDSVGYWSDTIKTKYKDMDVSLYFERQYSDDDNNIMMLTGIETSSSSCKTSSGIAVGDEKSAILPAYENNPIDMGPDWEQVNDSTWAMSKTKYSIRVRDDKWDRELIFHLVDKKVTSMQASIVMGE